MTQAVRSRFFDRHDRFFDTSYVKTRLPDGTRSPRLNHRYEAIITQLRSAFPGKRVLDLASHDGRWSLAALDAGASYVLGIEGRDHLVEQANNTFIQYNIDKEKYDFIVSDIFNSFKNMKSGDFDIVLCLGFFYHTARHYEVFNNLFRIKPKYIVLDTEIIIGHGPIVRFKKEPHDTDHMTLRTTAGLPRSIVGVPNHEMIAFLSEHFGYKLRLVDWHSLGITDWRDTEDYRDDKRRTYILEA